MEPSKLDAKDLKDSELVTLHRAIFEKTIKKRIPSLKNRKIALKWYDLKINKDNIRLYYNQKLMVFCKALLSDNLESIVKHNSFQ